MMNPINLHLSKFLKLPIRLKIVLMILMDTSLCCFSIWFSYYLRLGNFSTPINMMVIPITLSMFISFLTFWFLGIYRDINRVFDTHNLIRLASAILMYSIFFILIITIFSVQNVPRTIGFIQPFIYLFLLIVVRFSLSFLLKYEQIDNKTHKNLALIYGSGNAGVQLMKSLVNSNLSVEGFLDDNEELHGRKINGKVVYSSNDIKDLIKFKKISHVLLAIPSLKRNDRNRIFREILKHPLTIKALPTLSDLAEGLVKTTDIQEPDIEDLLGREQIDPKINLMKKNISNKLVLVTGAGGSIGSELCKQILKLGPKKLILFENNEFSLYKVVSLLNDIKEKSIKLKNIELVSLLRSVNDKDLVEETVSLWKPDTIFHSAAYKHVSLVEQNIVEGIKTNFFGTLNFFNSCIANKVSTFVFISTDKAVMPTNTMGASKRLAEMYLQSLNQYKKDESITNLSIVRFGNVLDSSGSVIPIFKKQILYGGPITLSHRDATRYFMTIPEASALVIQASAMLKNNEIFVLDMGKPIKILDLAVKMIRFSGLSLKDKSNPNGDISIMIKGLYPGEKLHEDLLIGKNPLPTEHPKISKVNDSLIAFEILDKKINELKILIKNRKIEEILKFLNKLSDEFNLKDNRMDWNLKKK